MRTIKKYHTPGYVLSRLMQIAFQWTYPNAPWLTKDSILLLEQLILKPDRGLEFGSGRSTKWLASRCTHLISVEHDLHWFQRVSQALSETKNVTYLHKSVHSESGEDSEYLEVFKSMEMGSIDFILNDGKLRDGVAIKSIDILKPGGLLILDNAERYIPNELALPESIGKMSNFSSQVWREFENVTQVWRRIWTSDGVSSTLIMFKP